MTITEFLEARIREDEVSATLREWHVDGCDSIPHGDYSFPCDCGLPERMAAECAAKRAILEQHQSRIYTDEEPGFSMILWDCFCHRQSLKPCPTIAALAAVYKDHPDYEPGWAL